MRNPQPSPNVLCAALSVLSGAESGPGMLTAPRLPVQQMQPAIPFS
jgi:hypothetical protein